MMRASGKLYRRWRMLAHQGMTQHDLPGASKYFDARAIGLLVSIAPMIPLMISDEMGIDRGWLWYSWAAVAAAWLVFVLATILRVFFRSAVLSWKEWQAKRRP